MKIYTVIYITLLIILLGVFIYAHLQEWGWLK